MKTEDNTQLVEKSDRVTWFDAVNVVVGSLSGFWAGTIALAIITASNTTMRLELRAHLAAICLLLIISLGSFFASLPENFGPLRNELWHRMSFHLLESIVAVIFAVVIGCLTVGIIVTIACVARGSF